MEDVKDNSDALYACLAKATEPPPEDAVPAEEVPAPRLLPNGDLVLIRRLAADEKTKGGIILPQSMAKDFFRAEVLALGRGHYEYGQWVTTLHAQPGDIVLVQDEREIPGRGIVQKHLIPVTPDDKQFLLCPGHMVYAIEEHDDES